MGKWMMCVLFTLGIGCGPQWVEYRPATAQSQAPADDLYSAAVRVLVSDGYDIASKDRGAGSIVTEWEEEPGFAAPNRFRWLITIDDGEVLVTLQCEEGRKNSLGHVKWVKCQDYRPPEKVKAGESLAVAIAEGR